MSDDELVTLGAFSTDAAAQLARARLESEGIFAFVADQFISSSFSGAAGGFRLQVRASDSAQAALILKDELGENEKPVNIDPVRIPLLGAVLGILIFLAASRLGGLGFLVVWIAMIILYAKLRSRGSSSSLLRAVSFTAGFPVTLGIFTFTPDTAKRDALDAGMAQ